MTKDTAMDRVIQVLRIGPATIYELNGILGPSEPTVLALLDEGRIRKIPRVPPYVAFEGHELGSYALVLNEGSPYRGVPLGEGYVSRPVHQSEGRDR